MAAGDEAEPTTTDLLSELLKLADLAKEKPVWAALIALAVIGFLYYRRRNPLVMDLQDSVATRDAKTLLPKQKLTGLANVRRIHVHNPTKTTTVSGVTITLDLCVQQPTRAIKLQRDGDGKHPFTVDPHGDVYIYVIAQIPGATEWVFLYDPKEKEPATIRKRRLDLVIGMTATGRFKKKFEVSVSEDGNGNLDMYETRPPRRFFGIFPPLSRG